MSKCYICNKESSQNICTDCTKTLPKFDIPTDKQSAIPGGRIPQVRIPLSLSPIRDDDSSDYTYNQFYQAWHNKGCLPVGFSNVKYQMKELLSLPGAPVHIPKILSTIVREAEESRLQLSKLFKRIDHTGYGQAMSIRDSTGGLYAADIAEGGEYPERTLFCGGVAQLQINKVGLALRLTEENIRFNQFDLINIQLQACGAALARHKEQKAISHIQRMGLSIFDNVAPLKSMLGCTTGRSALQSPNGSVRITDLEDAIAQIMVQGYSCNAIAMHPLTFSKITYNQAVANFFRATCGIEKTNMTTSLGMPRYRREHQAPYTLYLNPFIPYDPRRKLSDIYIFDSDNLGYMGVDEDTCLETFEDPVRDILKIKLRERYGFMIANEGQAVGLIKNVYISEPHLGRNDFSFQSVIDEPTLQNNK